MLETETIFREILDTDGNIVYGERSVESHGESYPACYRKAAADRTTLLRGYVTPWAGPTPPPSNIVQAAAGSKR